MIGDLIIIYAVFVYVLVTGVLLFWNKTDIINKFKVFIGAQQGAKLFRLYKKDGTEEEFVDKTNTGGVIKHEGDYYSILKGTINHSRSKNCPGVILIEGNLNSIDPHGEVDNRVDVKQLRWLFNTEREKSKDDLTPEVQTLKKLLIVALLVLGIALIISVFNWQAIETLTSTVGTTAIATGTKGAVVL